MTGSGRAFHRHAEAVVASELVRARRLLDGLPAVERAAVEALAARVSSAIVDGVLDRALREPSLAAALVSIYGADVPVDPAAVPCLAD